MKKEITDNWNSWLDNIDETISKDLKSNIDLVTQIKSDKRFGNQVIRYMNIKDQYKDWNMFQDYASILDAHHKTNILDVYPEFKPYWQ